ncbi:MAG: hypothetical protein K1X89_01820 [Myxococcaceae bacterium]|nr:hypothetical protein [Myxococcaceae bacterium]
MQTQTPEKHEAQPQQTFIIFVNGRKLEFHNQLEEARVILDRAGFTGTFCLAATHGESGKIEREFAEHEQVDLRKYHHFRATFCGPEVVA